MLGDAIINFFADFGIIGELFSLFIIYFIDSTLFPTLPEFFLLVIYSTNPCLGWGIVLILVSLASTFVGNSIIYGIAKKYEIPFIKKIMEKYSNILISKNEKMLLINRIAPVLPYAGAFIAVNKWDYRKSMFYIIIGGAIKFSILIALSATFYSLFERGLAQKATFYLIIATIILGFILSYFRKINHKGE